MKKIFIFIFALFCIVFFGCVMDSAPGFVTCDLKTEKTYFLPFNRSTLFKVNLMAGHPYSEFTEDNVNDSMYYIYCPAKKSSDDVVFECKIRNIGADSVFIQTYKVVCVFFYDHNDQELYKTLSSGEYLKLFENNFISKLKDKEIMNSRFYFDNMNDYEVWKTIGQRSYDSLNKAYKAKKIIPPL